MDPLDHALSLLPHGPEFRFIDRVTSLAPGEHGVAEYTVRGDEFFLRGHFPGEPIMPGVILLEACAQLAGVAAQGHPALAPLHDLKLTAIRAVKIFASAAPGDIIRLEARIVGRMAGLVQAAVTARVGDKQLLQGEVTLSGRPP